MLELGACFAGHEGRITVGSRDYDLAVVQLGELHVPSGVLGAVDPFVTLDSPLTTSIPPGTHPVYVTIADVSDSLDGSHLREAYLRVRVGAGTAVRVATVRPAWC